MTTAPATPMPSAIDVIATFDGSSMNHFCADGIRSTKLVLLGVCVLAMFHSAHRIRFTTEHGRCNWAGSTA